MPDDQNDLGDDQPSRLRTMYEEAAQAKATATARVAELERREAFRDAGLDLNNPLHKVVAEAYNGELTTESVKQHVDALGLNSQPAPTPPPEIPTAEREALERIAGAGAGDGVAPPSGNEAQIQSLRDQMEAASRRGIPNELDRISIELARAMGNRIVNE